jgi:hypothetical protein
VGSARTQAPATRERCHWSPRRLWTPPCKQEWWPASGIVAGNNSQGGCKRLPSSLQTRSEICSLRHTVAGNPLTTNQPARFAKRQLQSERAKGPVHDCQEGCCTGPIQRTSRRHLQRGNCKVRNQRAPALKCATTPHRPPHAPPCPTPPVLPKKHMHKVGKCAQRPLVARPLRRPPKTGPALGFQSVPNQLAMHAERAVASCTSGCFRLHCTVVGVRGVAQERALSARTAGRGRQRNGLPWASSQAAATWVAAQTPPAAAAMRPLTTRSAPAKSRACLDGVDGPGFEDVPLRAIGCIHDTSHGLRQGQSRTGRNSPSLAVRFHCCCCVVVSSSPT